jgi:hypothetical protein
MDAITTVQAPPAEIVKPVPVAMRFGKITDEDIDVYHSCGAISKTKIDTFRDSPRLFQKKFITRELPRAEKSDALIIGSAVDTLALEGPAAFASRFIIEPDDAPRAVTKKQREAKKPSEETLAAIAYWDRFAAESKGKDVLSDKQAALVKRCADALHSNKTFARFMQFGESQVTFRISGSKFALQCRPDRWLEEGCDLTEGMPCIIDVKTITELPADNPDFLPRHIAEFGYHRGAYLYPEIVATVLKYRDNYRPPFILALVEKREPHAVLCRPVEETAREIGEREVNEALVRLKKCLTDDVWPETWDPPLTPVGLPGYYVRRALENTDSNLWG